MRQTHAFARSTILLLLVSVLLSSFYFHHAYGVVTVSTIIPPTGTQGIPVQFTATETGIVTADRPVTVLWEMNNDGTTNNGAWDPSESVIYDTNANGKFNSAETVIAGPTPPDLAIAKDDPKVRFVDTSGDIAWESPEPVVYDTNADNLYNTGEPVIAGATPTDGTTSLDDPKLEFVDADLVCVIGASGTSCQATWTFSATGTFSVTAIPVNTAGTVGNQKQQNIVITRPPPISILPLTSNVIFPGQVFMVSVVVGNSTNPVNDLDGWEATVHYDPAILTATGIGPANTICSGGACTGADYGSDALFSGYSVFRDPTLDDFTGTVILGSTFVTFPPVGPSGSGVLAQIDFAFDAPGGTSTSIHIQDNKLRSVAQGAINVITPSALDDGSTMSSGTLDFSPTTAVQNTPQTFTATATGGTQPYTFTWDFGDGAPAVTGASASHTYTSTGDFLAILSLSDNVGNTGAIMKTVTVTPPGPLCSQTGSCDFTFTPTAPDVGQSVTFTATAVGGTTPYTFSWDFGDGTAIVTGNPATHTYDSKGMKTVKLTITDSTTPTPATFDVTHTVTVSPLPLIVDFTFSPSSPNAGDSITFTATVTGGSTPYSFSWTFGDGGTSTVNPASHTYTTKGSKTVSITVTDANNVPITISHTVEVSPLSVDFTFSPSSPLVASQVTFTATASGGTVPYSFSWDFGDGGTGTGASATHSYAAAGTFSVILTGTDNNNANAAKSLSVTVVEPLTVTVTANPANGTAPLAVALRAFASGGSPSPSPTFFWNFGDGNTGTGVAPSHTYTNPGSYTATVTVTDSQSRTAQASKSINVVAAKTTLRITVNDSSNNPIPGAIVQITSAPQGQSLPTSKTTGSDGSVVFDNLLLGTYTYNVTAAGFQSDTKTLTVPPGSYNSQSTIVLSSSSSGNNLYLILAAVAAAAIVAAALLYVRRRRKVKPVPAKAKPAPRKV